jgi:hypothetical protein
MKLILTAAVAIMPLLAKDNEPAKRLNDAAAVFSEVMAAPDKGIPQEMLEHAHCIVIVPDLKTAAFVIGGKYGKGYLSCRNKVGGWSAPGTVRIEGGSVGFQIGGSSTDLIMLVMNERGADKLLSSKFTWARRVPLPRVRWDVPRRLKPTRKCTRTFFRGPEPRGCLLVSLWKAPLCGRIWTITPPFMERDWRTGPSCHKTGGSPKRP